MGVAPQTAQARDVARCRAPREDLGEADALITIWVRYGLHMPDAPRAVLLDLPLDISDVCDAWAIVRAEQQRKQARRDEQRALLKRMGLMQ